MRKSNKKPKVLFYDAETTYVLARIWGTGKQFIGHDQIVDGQRTKIICIAYKWEDEKKIHCLVWDMKKQNCDKVIEEFSKIVEKADVAIAHNGDRFDVRQINTQRLMAGQGPIAWPTTEDSLKQLRQIFAFPSYKLDYIAKTLLGEGKPPMSRRDWVAVIEDKDEKALRKMVKYCKRDVQLLADAYARVKPFLKPKVNRAQITMGGCESCGSEEVQRRGKVTTKAGRYYRYQCQSCGHWFRDTKQVHSRDKEDEFANLAAQTEEE